MKAREGEHPFGDAGQLISLVTFLTVWVADSFFLRLSTLLSNRLPLCVRPPLAGLCFAVAVLLLRSGHVGVARSRPEGILTTGAFRYVRHPLYLARLLAYLGLTVSTASLFSLVLLAGILAFHDHIASYEERLLEARFPQAYPQYRARTGKWLPRISRVSARLVTRR